ncbi:protein gar2-like [Nicotiana sylvestris]|uniref:protein gar2-like n=1 Tax=Nicotiana sylvestris TaxID=4096 RepID=UPI00388CC408
MTNPQDNPGTPPQPTPSDSSTPPPPSLTLKPRLRRLKMLARKTVISGDLSKKSNEQLKASQAQNSDSTSDSESYKFASKREGPGSSEFEKAQESPSKVSSSLTENLENRFILVGSIRDVELPKLRRSGDIVEESGKKSGGSGSDKATEGLVNLSSQGDEPGSSVVETLASLLKRVGASYDPKKRRTPTPEPPSAPKPSKKQKASSPTPTETSLPKGRATRSRVKQSESDLQKALAKSKKKRMAKGKGKVAESSEAIDIEQMEQAVEPSLAKRTRSVVKSKQVRVSEEEEWSGEEESESDGEQDKLAKFGKRKFLKGRLLKDLMEPRMIRLVDTLAAQG